MAVPGEDQQQGPLTEEWGEQWSPGSGAAGSPRGFRRRPENVELVGLRGKKKFTLQVQRERGKRERSSRSLLGKPELPRLRRKVYCRRKRRLGTNKL